MSAQDRQPQLVVSRVNAFIEQHFTPAELAERWHVADNTVRRWCEEEGGVLTIDRPETRSKRGYRTIRIPESTARKIYLKHFRAAA